jgi:vacuolar-type H+-ATPase subunit H
MSKEHAPPRPDDDPAGRAIASVLRAETAARREIEQAQRQADQIAEEARSNARALAERTERRIRRVVATFEQETTRFIAEIDAEAARMSVPHALSDAETETLDRAVAALARELAAGPT